MRNRQFKDELKRQIQMKWKSLKSAFQLLSHRVRQSDSYKEFNEFLDRPVFTYAYWQRFNRRNRILWFCFFSSTFLMVTFNNCGTLPHINRTIEPKAEMPSYHSKITSQEIVGSQVPGLDRYEIRNFSVSKGADNILIDAVEQNPQDQRESGLVKTFLFRQSSQKVWDPCDMFSFEILENNCRAAGLDNEASKLAIITLDILMGTQDRDQADDAYVVNLKSGKRELVESSLSGDEVVSSIKSGSLSGNGRYFVFVSDSWSGDDEGSGYQQVLIKDLVDQSVRPVSVSLNGNYGDGHSWGASVSSDGKRVLFHSNATNIIEDADDGNDHIFVKDLETGQLVWIDRPVTGLAPREDTHSFDGTLSADGRYVAFASEAESLVEEDGNGFVDIFVRDLRRDVIELASKTPAGQRAKGDCTKPQLSSDGGILAFVCEPLAFGLGTKVGVPEVYVIDTRVNELRPVELPTSQETAAVQVMRLTGDGQNLFLGFSNSDSRRLNLYQFSLIQ